MNRRRIGLVSGLCIAAMAAFVLLWRLEEHDLDWRASEPFTFIANDASLTGTLWLPDDQAIAAVVLVHGDGPQDRSSDGGYAPLINTLLEAGIAVASWDKPGIGSSGGSWLDQSMVDRATEARAALAVLGHRLTGIPVGALGFSQAGWVLPKLTSRDAVFIVLVGPAVSWQRQGAYYTRTRLRLSGMSTPEIERALARSAVDDDHLFGRPHIEPSALPGGMEPDRWVFIRRNRNEDANDDLRNLNVPLLALWGAEDLNVDANDDAAIYRETVTANHPENRVVIVAEATHGLLKAGPYNTQLVSDWSWYTTLRYLMEGRYAFAPGSLEMICKWIIAPRSPLPVSSRKVGNP